MLVALKGNFCKFVLSKDVVLACFACARSKFNFKLNDGNNNHFLNSNRFLTSKTAILSRAVRVLISFIAPSHVKTKMQIFAWCWGRTISHF